MGYRFFVNEAVHFQQSLHMRFAARAHDVAGMAYWYTAVPVRPYYQMAPREQRLPGSEVQPVENSCPAAGRAHGAVPP